MRCLPGRPASVCRANDFVADFVELVACNRVGAASKSSELTFFWVGSYRNLAGGLADHQVGLDHRLASVGIGTGAANAA